MILEAAIGVTFFLFYLVAFRWTHVEVYDGIWLSKAGLAYVGWKRKKELDRIPSFVEEVE